MPEPQITELTELQVDQVDGVFAGANGMPFLVLKSAAPDEPATTASGASTIPDSGKTGSEPAAAEPVVKAEGDEPAGDSAGKPESEVAKADAGGGDDGDEPDDDEYDKPGDVAKAEETAPADEPVAKAEGDESPRSNADDAGAGEPVAKAGRRISAATESSLKQAMATLDAVLNGTLSAGPDPADEQPAAADADGEEDVMKALETPEFAAVLKSTLADVVKEELGAALKPLEDRLAVVEGQPMPGGPVLKGKAASTDAAEYSEQVVTRSEPADAELAPVLKALETEKDPAKIAELQADAGRIRLSRLFSGR